MTTHQARRRLKRINRAARKNRFTPEIRAHILWAQNLNRPEPQDSKAADDDEERWAPE